MKNLLIVDINCEPIFPKLGQFPCMLLVRIHLPGDAESSYLVEKFGRN